VRHIIIITTLMCEQHFPPGSSWSVSTASSLAAPFPSASTCAPSPQHHNPSATHAPRSYGTSADPVASIVVDSSPHGTHVAGIVAAHFPSDAALDGVVNMSFIAVVDVVDVVVAVFVVAAAAAAGGGGVVVGINIIIFITIMIR